MNGHASIPAQSDPVAIDPRPLSRNRSDSAYARTGNNDGGTGNGNVYSDDSDVEPHDKVVVTSTKQPNLVHAADSQTSLQPTPSYNPTQSRPSLIADTSDPPLTSAEKLAQALQHALAPPPPDSVTALSALTRQSVAAIVTAVQSHDSSNRPLAQASLENRIADSVIAIRHLLYISSPPYGHVPSHLYPRDGAASSSSIPQLLQAQLKPAQRRVTATLSKLVLAALAAQYDTKSFTSEVSERMETDAAELDRALVTFVTEVQKINDQVPHEPSKRLFAALLPTNVGLGLMGAGAAGGWKGFGWVGTDAQRQPRRDLSTDVLAELKATIAQLEEKLVDLHSTVFEGGEGESLIHSYAALSESHHFVVRQIYGLGQIAIAWLHLVLSSFADVNLARTVDIDGISREGHSGDAYLQSVHKARALVRAVEAYLQSLYDDGASLLLVITTPPSFWTGPLSPPSERVRSLSVSIKNNVAQSFQTLEALLSVGQEQAANGPSDYRGSIEWRMSRILTSDSNLGRTLKELAFEDDSYDEGEDLVDIEHAFGRKPGALKPSAPLGMSHSSSALYSNPSQTSESSLEAAPRPRAESAPLPPSWGAQHSATTANSTLAPPSPPGSEVAAGLLDDDDKGSLVLSCVSPQANGEMGFADAAATTPSNAKSSSGAADKLIRVLGDAPTHIIDKLNAKTKPWYLRPNYEDSEIQIDPDGKVRAGTAPALVERLTAHEHSGLCRATMLPVVTATDCKLLDTTFTKTFLLTYKSFTDAEALFNLLVSRFWIKPPETLSPEELDDWTKHKQHIIRMRYGGLVYFRGYI